MENKYYYGFIFIFNFDNNDILCLDNEYLNVGFSYLGYIVGIKIYRNIDFKYKIDIKNVINLLIKEFDKLLKKDEIFKYTKLDYDIMYKELENMIKNKIKQCDRLIEVY
jgi:hypothetical protein